MLLNCGVGEDSWASLGLQGVKPFHPKWNQSWIFTGRTDAEADTPKLWPPDVKNWLTGKDHDAGKDWRQEEKGTTENEMVGWHHRLNGHEPEQALRVGDGQGSLVCCSPWVAKTQTWSHDWTDWWNLYKKLKIYFFIISIFGVNYCHFAVGPNAIHTLESRSDITGTPYEWSFATEKTSARDIAYIPAQ